MGIRYDEKYSRLQGSESDWVRKHSGWECFQQIQQPRKELHILAVVQTEAQRLRKPQGMKREIGQDAIGHSLTEFVRGKIGNVEWGQKYSL